MHMHGGIFYVKAKPKYNFLCNALNSQLNTFLHLRIKKKIMLFFLKIITFNVTMPS